MPPTIHPYVQAYIDVPEVEAGICGRTRLDNDVANLWQLLHVPYLPHTYLGTVPTWRLLGPTAWRSLPIYAWPTYNYIFTISFLSMCEQAKRTSNVCICLIWKNKTVMKTLPGLTVGIVVLLSLCSAWILLCCHVESLDLGRKWNHGHEPTEQTDRQADGAKFDFGEVLWGSISLSLTPNM